MHIPVYIRVHTTYGACTFLHVLYFQFMCVHICCLGMCVKEEGGGRCGGRSGCFWALAAPTVNKQLITRVLNQGELASGGS